MKKYFIVITAILIGLSTGIKSQNINPKSGSNPAELYNLIEAEYGFDQELVTGIFYVNRYLKALGNPFFGDNNFTKGTIVFRNKIYQNVNLKYDMYEHKLLVNYQMGYKQVNFLLPNKFISHFGFDNKFFEYFDFKDIDSGFYQVISDKNELKCLYYWYKKRSVSNHIRAYSSFEFSESLRKSYLLSTGKIMSFTGNKSFVRFFNEKDRPLIKSYIRQKHIKVKSCDDTEMFKLITYCSSVENEKSTKTD